MQENNQANVPQVDHDLNEPMPSGHVTAAEREVEEQQTFASPAEGDSKEQRQEEDANVQRELEELKLENEKQKQTIAALTGTEGITVDTNDLAVLYHLQLRETQRLQNEIDRLHQMLSDVFDVEPAHP